MTRSRFGGGRSVLCPRISLATPAATVAARRRRREVLALFRQIVESERVTLLMVSHDPLVGEYADQALLLEDFHGLLLFGWLSA